MPQGSDFGALGVPRGSFFSNMVMWHIKSTGTTSRQNASKIVILESGDLGVSSKGQTSLNFGLHVNFKDFYTKLCVCSHK